MLSKICSKCERNLLASNFNKQSSGRLGLKSQCRDCIRAYREANRDKILAKERARVAADPEKQLEHRKRHYYKNRKKVLAAQLKRQKEKLLADPNFKLIRRLRNRVYYALKGHKKQQTTAELLGCSLTQFKEHLESMFLPGMSWENYGKWHVDHKKPCASFNLSDPQQLKECFHHSNTQPLWALDNIRKSDFDLAGPNLTLGSKN